MRYVSNEALKKLLYLKELQCRIPIKSKEYFNRKIHVMNANNTTDKYHYIQNIKRKPFPCKAITDNFSE